MTLPGLYPISRKSRRTTVFGGLNLCDAAENEFCEMLNLCADATPALTVRKPRAMWYEKKTENGKTVLTEGLRMTNLNGITAAECIDDKIVYCTDRNVYYDGRTLEGVTLNGSSKHRIAAFGRGFFILPEKIFVEVTTSGVNVSSTDAPEMDFIICRGNRLYGCRYGESSDGITVNEIYVCKQGDPKSWSVYEGISTDGYTASVGVPGAFTGIAVCGDAVLFFKENAIIRMTGDYPAEYCVSALPCEGVEEGAEKTVVNILDRVFYKSRNGITVYDGTAPEVISGKLGIQPFEDCCAGAIGNRYYIAMTLDGKRNLYVFDLKTGLWHCEDGEYIRYFVRRKNCLCTIKNPLTATFGTGGIRYYSFGITDFRFTPDNANIFSGEAGTYEYGKEPDFEWSAKTGRINSFSDESLILRELVINLSARDADSLCVKVFVNGEKNGRAALTRQGVERGLIRLKTFVPACDFFSIEISGRGGATIYSITKIYEEVRKR